MTEVPPPAAVFAHPRNAAADCPAADRSDAARPGAGPDGRRASRRRFLKLVGISLGYFMVLLDLTVLSVAEPDLAASLGASTSGLQWATTAYTVLFAALLLSAGAVADRYGAHRVFKAGTAAFGLVSLACAAAPGLGTLIAARALLGVAAAAVVPASLALVARLYPDPGERTRAVAAWAAISGAAVAAGPVAGGLLVELGGWRAIFVVNAPIAAVVLLTVVGPAVVCPRGRQRIDWWAQGAACLALAVPTDAVIAAGSAAWGHAAASGVLTVPAVAVFRRLERRSTAPVLGGGLLRSRGVRAGLGVGAAVNFTLAGDLFVLPLLLRHEHALGPVATGLAFLPLTLPFVANPPVTGRIVARTGPRLPILAGMALLTVGGLVLAAAAWATSPYPVLAGGLLLTGFGISFALPALVAAVVAAAPEGTAGSAGGVLNAARQTGATLGVAVMGALAGTDPTPGGAAAALAFAAVVCAAAGGTFARRPPRATA
ncbi:MFS transporter [Streptodolium elevatio]